MNGWQCLLKKERAKEERNEGNIKRKKQRDGKNKYKEKT